MDSESFVLSLLNEKVKLSAKYVNKNYKEYLLKALIIRNEGKCSKHGYIKKGSIELKRVSVGMVEIQSLRGFVNYDIQFSALVCNPTTGSILKCKIINSNNFGILCVCGITENAAFVPIIDIIIPKNTVNIQSNTQIDLESLNNEDIIHVQILGKKFEINDIKISAVGKIVDVGNNIKPMVDVDNNEIDSNAIDSDEEAYEDDFEEVENIPKFKRETSKYDTANDDDDEEKEEEDDDPEQEDEERSNVEDIEGDDEEVEYEEDEERSVVEEIDLTKQNRKGKKQNKEDSSDDESVNE